MKTKIIGRTILPFVLSAALIAQPVNAEAVSPAGVDQVLSAFAEVVRERANEIALDIVRQQLVANLDGRMISLKLENSKLVTMYLGHAPSGAENFRVFFKKSFERLSADNLSITDPILLKTISEDLVEFVFRVSLNSLDDIQFQTLHMRDISAFTYRAIEMMASPSPDVHGLSDPLLKLADDVSSGFCADLNLKMAGHKFDEKSTPIILTPSNIGDLLGMQIEYMTAKKTEKFSFAEIHKQKAAAIGNKYQTDPSYFAKSYLESNSNAKNEFAAFFKLIGSILLAHEVDSIKAAAWLQEFSKQTGSCVNANGSNAKQTLLKILAVLDQPALKDDSDFVKTKLGDAFRNMVNVLMLRIFTTKLDALETNADLIPSVLRILNNLRILGSMENPNPSNVGSALCKLMNNFSDLIEKLKKTGGDSDASDAPGVLKSAASILELVSERDWTSLVGLIYDTPGIVNKNGLDGRMVTFMKVLMQMYKADSQDAAKKILSAALQDISSRKNRYENNVTVDIACLLGFGGGVEATPYQLQPIDQHIFGGLYAPLGIQIGHPGWGFIAYPVDLGVYLSTSDQTPNDRVNDAVRFGVAVYLRWKELPVNLGIGGDYKPGFSGGDPVYRALIFSSLEIPLFMLK